MRMATKVHGADVIADGLERGLVDCARGQVLVHVRQHCRAGQDHCERVRNVLALERRCGAMRSLGHHNGRVVVVVDGEQQ